MVHRSPLPRLPQLRQLASAIALSLRQPAVWLTVLGVTATIAGVRQLGLLQAAELAAYDQLVRLRPDPVPDSRLLTVLITETDIQQQRTWPLPDQTLAQALTTLKAAQPTAIGLDLYRDLPVEPGHAQLSQVFQSSDRIVPVCKVQATNEPAVAPPPSVPPEQAGFADIVTDPDGVVRRNLLALTQPEGKCTTPYSLSLQLALIYLLDQGIEPQLTPQKDLQIGSVVIKPLTASIGGYQRMDDRGYQILLNYRSGQNSTPTVTLAELLAGQVDPQLIRDRIVLIGVSAPSIKDSFFTPYSPAATQNPQMPGVIVHAQMVSQILSAVLDGQPLFWSWPDWAELLWIGGWALVGGTIAWRIRRPLILVGAVLAVGVVLVGSCWVLFLQSGWIPLVPPAIALCLSSAGVVAYIGYQAQQEQQKVALQVREQEKAIALLQALLDESAAVPPQTEAAATNLADPNRELLASRYKITKVLGSGGFGRTYLAQDTLRPGQPICVVKQLQPARQDNKFLQVARRLFKTEAEILEKLGRHNQIPQLLAYFEDGQEFYLVQEFIDGHPLSQELTAKKPMADGYVIRLLKEVLEILVFVHLFQVIHRDLKPDNLIRRKGDYRLVLIDFGAVKQMRPQAVEAQEGKTVIVGTLGYAPPEQLAGQPGLNSDLYALGMIGIQALTGIHPRDLEKHSRTGEVVWPQVRASDQLVALLQKMVRYHFSDRYQTASEVLTDLRQVKPQN